MWLEYAEYVAMGGTLEDTAFVPLERKARYLINAQASGRCGARITELSALPECIKECVFELVSFISANDVTEKQIASESQSQGGANESLSYVTRTDAEIERQAENIIHDFFYGGGYGHLLYKGASI